MYLLLFYRSIVCARGARGGGGWWGGKGLFSVGGVSNVYQPQCDRLRRKIIAHAPTPIRHVIQVSLSHSLKSSVSLRPALCAGFVFVSVPSLLPFFALWVSRVHISCVLEGKTANARVSVSAVILT